MCVIFLIKKYIYTSCFTQDDVALHGFTFTLTHPRLYNYITHMYIKNHIHEQQ